MTFHYTRAGDSGKTTLHGGHLVSKHHPRVDAYGEVDELCSVVGWVLAAKLERPTRDALAFVQSDLMTIASDLSTPLGDHPVPITRLHEGATQRLEKTVDTDGKDLPPLHHFILPGGSEAAARLHVARTVCRRAERSAALLSEKEAVNPECLRYLNRLSSLFFVLARLENQACGCKEKEWHHA